MQCMHHSASSIRTSLWSNGANTGSYGADACSHWKGTLVRQTVLLKDKVVQVMKRFIQRYCTALQDFRSNIIHSHSLAGIEWTESFVTIMFRNGNRNSLLLHISVHCIVNGWSSTARSKNWVKIIVKHGGFVYITRSSTVIIKNLCGI